ncbi:MAG: glycosyltransferase family 9 protein [Prevotellaceae bacterium]|jgi:heptosyltransferase-2|nr:glycosyltransferase family 9 protein [Prevotellaceae bacterium]
MRFLIIQTAFIGDVILATALVEKLGRFFPTSQIDFLLRKGNEGLLANNSHVNNVWIWNKKDGKYRNLFKLLKPIQKQRYDFVINIQRFATTGLFSILTGAKQVIGFKKNPYSIFFNKRVDHHIGNGIHEVERNLKLIEDITDTSFEMPKLYPSTADFNAVEIYKKQPYITISPTSVWYTKQLPLEKWEKLMKLIDKNKYKIYLLGGIGDKEACEKLVNLNSVKNLAGKLTLLQSAALMCDANMNYVNDSAPQHLASAMNAPVTSVFCSTVPTFGFGPLSKNSRIVEVDERLRCRPCGLHGYKACPKGHFLCAHNIEVEKMLF